jgi:hypothetical protein
MRKSPYNSTYPKVAVKWLNQALCCYHSLRLVDSEVLRYRHLRVAAKRKPLKMRPYIYVIVFGLILFSCSQKRIESLDGHWLFDFNGKIESLYFPLELCFEGDSLTLIDGYSFNHKVRYQIIEDSIEMIFSNENIRKLKFGFCTDSIITIGLGKYRKVYNNFQCYAKPYKLIGYKTDEILNDSTYSWVIHLVKVNGRLKMILNNCTTDLKNIPEYLITSHRTPLRLILYLGKGLEFNDLIEAYMWINFINSHEVTLVTGNDCFDKFYMVKDFIHIDNSLIEEFLKKENLPPFIPLPVDNSETKRQIIRIKNQIDFEKLLSKNDSTKYLILVNNQLGLLDYLEMTKKLSKKSNILKVITAYNK